MSAVSSLPILYSFRRCPYAIRARMALAASGIPVELREVELKDKPEELGLASSKATIPVLVTEQGRVLDESLDIMCWALAHNDPFGWLPQRKRQRFAANAIIETCDQHFKAWLDRYKYADRHPERRQQDYRSECEAFLAVLEHRLANNDYLCGDQQTFADIAIFPFIRQFAHVDREWFASSPYVRLQQWLEQHTEHQLFDEVMQKQEPWKQHRQQVIFPNIDHDLPRTA